MFKVVRTFKQNTEKFPKTREWECNTFEEAQATLEEDLKKIKKFKTGLKMAMQKKDGTRVSQGKIIDAVTTGSYAEVGDKIKHEITTDFKIKNTWTYTIIEA